MLSPIARENTVCWNIKKDAKSELRGRQEDLRDIYVKHFTPCIALYISSQMTRIYKFLEDENGNI